MEMRYRKGFLIGIILFFCPISTGFTEEFPLQYFLAKIQSGEGELSKQEKAELLNRLEGVMEQAKRINGNLIQAVQSGEVKVEYQEGMLWMSKFGDDRGSIDTAIRQLKLLKEKPAHLTGAVRLYKSLRDLSSNFNAYNNTPLLSAIVGDLGPEIELWADPVFYKLYLMPLAHSRDIETKSPLKEKAPIPAGKKP